MRKKNSILIITSLLSLFVLSNSQALTISGTVGTVDGVTMNGLPDNPVTTNGSYSATVTYGWSGTVIPAKAGYKFSPASKTYTNVTADQTQNYTSTPTYMISGTVGILDGVTMSGLPGNPVTSGGGNYTATVVYGWSGTVTPTKAGFTFSPATKTYSNVTADKTPENYTPTQLTYVISGTGMVDGVTMNGLPGSPVTSGGGNYSATVVYYWSGTVTPAKTGYTFSPASRVYSLVNSNKTNQYYIPRFVISGNVGTVDGVTISGLPGSPVTSGGGNYNATVDYGWSATVTPRKTGYTFNPASQTYSNVTSDLNSQDYTPTALPAYMISGVVGTLDGVTMNGLPGYPATNGGSYNAIIYQGWSGTVTPAKTGYTFSPASMTYSNVTADQTAQNYTPTQLIYTISGTVGTLDGVTMGGLPGNPVTSGGGYYTATVVYGWSGTVIPAKTGYTFSPASKTYSYVTSNQTQNYTPTFIISGKIGILEGVTMSGLPGNPITNRNGLYSCTIAPGWSGTVTPSKAGYTFSPSSMSYSNVTADQAQDYTPTLLTFTISGTAGTLDGVTMSGLTGSPVTSGGGNYTATVIYGWNGTVTPAKAGYTFSPASKTYSNVTSDLNSQDYTPAALPAYTISGLVGTLDGVTMNGIPGNPVTSGGSYNATVYQGWSGTVTPTKAGYIFSPASKSYSNVTADQAAQNYTPIPTYVISGTVGSVDGVTMGGLPGSPVTSGGGNYTATVVYGWSGTVSPAKAGYIFSPVSKVYNNVTADQIAENYTSPRYSGGEGSAENPWKISSKADLLALGANTSDYSGYFILTNDIDMQNEAFTNSIIAKDLDQSDSDGEGFQGTVFTGCFDGNGFNIINLNVSARFYVGLFGYLEGQVKNLGLPNCNLATTEYAGAIAGTSASAVISNCFSSGTVNAAAGEGGGLVGYAYNSQINNCFSSCSFPAYPNNRNNIGGIVGWCYVSNISNCYSACSISANSNIGGIAGQSEQSNISNCYSASNINGSSTFAGLVGKINGGTVSNCFFDSQIQTHGVTQSVATNNDGTVTNVLALTTAQMQQKAIYTTDPANWDFVNTWRLCSDGQYPTLVCQYDFIGDFTCPDGVNLLDAAAMGSTWKTENGTDLPDLILLAQNWLSGF